ncbi:unnamed protein product [Vitrella brassicaformis CCMP3155]|uniref:monogalactosyldiacylglycerol synthase n=2 Tax=Vitrella brassicaformis TaxID=1169539 RepID=A0A0G4GUT2_VITBC|nr:unnamed protein product [Vitrella brassicaformis CCMP3155]|eukprot:CEM34604.1 unnamed protein product [Vitrella brassicaformis CCMP3155]
MSSFLPMLGRLCGTVQFLCFFIYSLLISVWETFGGCKVRRRRVTHNTPSPEDQQDGKQQLDTGKATIQQQQSTCISINDDSTTLDDPGSPSSIPSTATHTWASPPRPSSPDKSKKQQQQGQQSASEKPPCGDRYNVFGGPKREGVRRILIVLSDTGGGHKTAALSLEQAFDHLYGNNGDDADAAAARQVKRVLMEEWEGGEGVQLEIRAVDVWTDFARYPFNEFVWYFRFYAARPQLWVFFYSLFTLWPFKRFAEAWGFHHNYDHFARLLQASQPDLLLSVHPLCQHPFLRTMATIGMHNVPLVTVVTDLQTPHIFWWAPGVHTYFVPSDAVRTLALKQPFIDESQVRVRGLPLRKGFWSTERSTSKQAMRAALGWREDAATCLVIGGGEGIGGLAATVRAIVSQLKRHKSPPISTSNKGGDEEKGSGIPSSSPASYQLIVVCGRNDGVKNKLERLFPPKSHHHASRRPHLSKSEKKPLVSQRAKAGAVWVGIYGFVDNMSDVMAAADCLVTKAGPGTIAEACTQGLPVLLSSYLPGQETGNIPFVEDGRFGAYAPRKDALGRAVRRWLDDPDMRDEMGRRAIEKATPSATLQIAREIGDGIVGLRPQQQQPQQ